MRQGALVAGFSLISADAAGVLATSNMLEVTAPLIGLVAAASLLVAWCPELQMRSRDVQ